MTLQLLDGQEAREHAAELELLYADVYAGLTYSADPEDREFGARFRTHSRQPGFALAEARSGGYLIGCAMGMPLRPATSWWREVTTPLAEDVTAEHPGPTLWCAARGGGRASAARCTTSSSRGEPRSGRRWSSRRPPPRLRPPSRAGAGTRSPAPAPRVRACRHRT